MPEIYFDPVDPPAEGKFILITSRVYRRSRWRGATVEEALWKYLHGSQEEANDTLFRRVEPDSWDADLSVWEVSSLRSKVPDTNDTNSRLLGCLQPMDTFARTVRIDPVLAARYGIIEVYVRSEDNADNYCYLDRTGKVRPVRLIVDGHAIEPGVPDDELRTAIEEAIVDGLEPVFQYPEADGALQKS